MQQVAETGGWTVQLCVCVRVLSHGPVHRACLPCPQISLLICRVSHSQFPAPVRDSPAPCSTGDAREASDERLLRFAASPNVMRLVSRKKEAGLVAHGGTDAPGVPSTLSWNQL